MSVSFLQRENAPDLAYRIIPAKNEAFPYVIFLSGFRSDMNGTKAQFLAGHCADKGQGLVLFDYRGHGQSGGGFEDGTIALWLQDALDIIDHTTQGRILLVGSSMGGWIGLLAALARKDRLAGFIGIAAAPDFTRHILHEMNEAQHAELEERGQFTLPTDYEETPHILTRAMLEGGEAYCLLDKPIAINAPVRLIQGMKDTDVPWQTAHRILNALTGSDKKAYLREEGDHRLSSPDDLALLTQLVDELSKV